MVRAQTQSEDEEDARSDGLQEEDEAPKRRRTGKKKAITSMCHFFSVLFC